MYVKFSRALVCSLCFVLSHVTADAHLQPNSSSTFLTQESLREFEGESTIILGVTLNTPER